MTSNAQNQVGEATTTKAKPNNKHNMWAQRQEDKHEYDMMGSA